jgi:hypothetical protein
MNECWEVRNGLVDGLGEKRMRRKSKEDERRRKSRADERKWYRVEARKWWVVEERELWEERGLEGETLINEKVGLVPWCNYKERPNWGRNMME